MSAGDGPLNPARALGTGPLGTGLGFGDVGSGDDACGPGGVGGQRPIRRPPSSPSRARIGVVFASHHDPEAVFRRHAGALLLLRGARVRYPRYTTAEQVGEALRQADIGLHDFGRRPDDALIAEFVLRQSEGLVAIMDPLLALVDGLARHNRVAGGRPTLALFEQALKGHARMVRVIEERANVPGGRRLRVVANGVAVAGQGARQRGPRAAGQSGRRGGRAAASDAAQKSRGDAPLARGSAGRDEAGRTAANAWPPSAGSRRPRESRSGR